MRYAIFSDVHGNLEALTAVLAFYRTQAVDSYVFLGDAIGYGANPNEVCDLIRPLAQVAILGNHDAAAVGRMAYEEYYDAARQALDWCKAQLSTENLEWMEKSPFKWRDGDLQFCHGSPLIPEMFDYVFSAEQVFDIVGHTDSLAHFTFIGHSHLTLSFKITGEDVAPMIVSEIAFEPDAKYLITVGSVGQPRDRDPRACCTIYDTEKRTVTYHRVPYDVQRARQQILDAGLAPIFGERLLAGI